MKKLILFAVFLMHLPLAFASEPFELTDRVYEMQDLKLRAQLEYYEDASGNLALPRVVQQGFKKLDNFTSRPYNPSSVYWYRVKLVNRTSNYKLWYLELTDPKIQSIKVFQISGPDTISFARTGFDEKFRSRLSDHKNFLFPVRLYGSDTCWLYFAVRNRYAVNNSICLRPAEQFLDYALNEYYFLGLFYGILLIMAIYNFFIYFSTRENVYLYYVAYVLCYCLNSFREDGIGFQFLWPDWPRLNSWINTWTPLLLIISFIFYSRKFLLLNRKAGKLDKWLTISLGVYCILFVLNHLFFHASWINYLYLFPFVMVYAGGIYVWKKGDRSARYFLLAFTFLVFGFTVFVLRLTNIVPPHIFTVYALNFGFLVEVVLFSYALGQRLKYEKDQKARMDEILIGQLRKNEQLKDSLNRELEKKVKERTRELSEALEELQVKNKKIEELNKLLESDNKALNQDIRNITRARLMLKDLTLDEFKKIYPDEEACLKYLSEIKWAKTYACRKCGNENSSGGKTLYSRRCTKCGYEESATSFTLFHKSKLPITTSFYLVYLVLADKNVSSHELSEKLGLRQKTCWAFKKKVVEAMNNGKSTRLNSREWGRIFYDQKASEKIIE